MVNDVKNMGTEEATNFVCPTPKRYKKYKRQHKMVPIKRLLKELKQRQAEGQLAHEYLHIITRNNATGVSVNNNLIEARETYENEAPMKETQVDQGDENLDILQNCAAVNEYQGPTYLKLKA